MFNQEKNARQLQSLKNAVRSLKLDGYEVHQKFEHDCRRTIGKYFLTDDNGNSLTGTWTYDKLNYFIMGYGKAKAPMHSKEEIADMIKKIKDTPMQIMRPQAMGGHLFPNGFTSWHETHFEIVEAITVIMLGYSDNQHNIVSQKQKDGGRSALYELAKELTDEFEKLHIGEKWEELDWYDTIEAFIKEKLYNSDKKVTEDIFGTLGAILRPETGGSKQKVYLAKCNNCNSILIDENPKTDAVKHELSGAELEMIKVGEGEDSHWACPNCMTDEHFMDI